MRAQGWSKEGLTNFRGGSRKTFPRLSLYLPIVTTWGWAYDTGTKDQDVYFTAREENSPLFLSPRHNTAVWVSVLASLSCLGVEWLRPMVILW